MWASYVICRNYVFQFFLEYVFFIYYYSFSTRKNLCFVLYKTVHNSEKWASVATFCKYPNLYLAYMYIKPYIHNTVRQHNGALMCIEQCESIHHNLLCTEARCNLVYICTIYKKGMKKDNDAYLSLLEMSFFVMWL